MDIFVQISSTFQIPRDVPRRPPTLGETLLRLRSRGKSKWKEVDARATFPRYRGTTEQL